VWSSGRVRNAPTNSPRPAQIRDTSDLEIPESIPQAATVVHAAGGDAVYVGLHHHRVQRLVDSSAGFEDRGVERVLAQFRDPQLDVAGLGGHQPGPGPVALGGAGLGAFIAAGADLFGGFGFRSVLA
jgi:hypothetical protein